MSLLFVGCGEEVIQNGLSPAQADEVVKALAGQGVRASVGRAGRGGYSVAVPSGQSARALAVLERKGLPRKERHGMEELMKRDSLVPRPEQERLGYLAALQSSLEETMESLPGVLEASIHVAVPVNTANAPMTPTGASVTLQVNAEEFSITSSQIQAMVAGSFSGMDPQKVSVIVVPREFPPLPATIRSSWNEYWPYVGWFLFLLSLAGNAFLWSRNRQGESGSGED